MDEKRKKIVIIGATSAMAEHCARLWVNEPVDLVLVARNKVKTEQIASDLRIRQPKAEIETRQVDFVNSVQIDELVKDIVSRGRVDIVLIAHGVLPEQKACETNLTVCRDALEINGISPLLFVEAFAGEMEKVNRGTIAVIGSVAGDRGRKSNYVYGSAKGLINHYVEGLHHRLANTQVKVVLIKPGPTATPMTANLGQKNVRMASVEDVAKDIVNGIKKEKKILYTPGKWALIMFIIRNLPGFIFNKLNI